MAGFTQRQLDEANARLLALENYLTLKFRKLTNRRIERKLGHDNVTLWRWLDKLHGKGLIVPCPDRGEPGSPRALLLAALAKERPAGRPTKTLLNDAEQKVIRSNLLVSNRTWNSGSTPEAVRQAIRTGELRPELAEEIRAREAAGLPAITETMRRRVRVSGTAVRSYRAPRDAWLKYVQSPGSLHLIRDEITGEQREIEPGEIITIDDGSINLCCCVPLKRPGDKCSENFGVIVGRFQFLLPGDHRTYYIPGFSYTARPKSSYRAEDLLATLHTTFRQHGIWPRATLERGISKSRLLHDALSRLGTKIKYARSPHEKVVEFIYNVLWTKFSFLPGQIGRYAGDEEAINSLLISCRAGATDPKKHFPMLADVLKTIREAIEEWNNHLVQSDQWGKWVPREWFAREAGKRLKPLDAASSWMFAPVVSEPRKVQGFYVATSVALMPGLSTRFTFRADWMHEYSGLDVRLHFNPFAPQSDAMVTLAQNWNGRKAGEALGMAEQVNALTRQRRRIFGWGEDPDIGHARAKADAQNLRRHVQGIRADGKPGIIAHEVREGSSGCARESAADLIGPGTVSRALTSAATPAPLPSSLQRLLQEEYS